LKGDAALSGIREKGRYTIAIDSLNHEGQGVGRINGLAVFVPGVIPGETAEIEIETLKKNYAVGKLIGLLEGSPERVSPFCEVFEDCGGCTLQHMSYDAQLRFKTGVVVESLKRIGGLTDVIVHETIGMKDCSRYRNKVQLPVGKSEGETVIGFFGKRSHRIVDCTECGIQNAAGDEVRKSVRRFINENGISVYDETTGRGLLRHILVRTAFTTGEIMVVIVINGDELPFKDKLVAALLESIPGLKSIVLNINKKNTNIVLGDKNRTIYGSPVIVDSIGSFKFEISPHSFFQVNPVQTRVLYEKALEYADLSGNETVFDIYCGIGTISLFLSEKAAKVYGVEVVEAAISDARRNAAINNVHNVEFITGAAEEIIPEMYKRGITADVAVVDPPRRGCAEPLLNTLAEMKPQRIVYVSCNPATLARDLKHLDNKGFKTMEIQPVDMFPWTAHVETIIMMTNCGLKGK